MISPTSSRAFDWPTTAGDRRQAEAVARQAEHVVGSLTDEPSRAKAVPVVAVVFTHAGNHERAQSLARSLASPAAQAKALTMVAAALAELADQPAGETLAQHAATLAYSVVDTYKSAKNLTALAVALGDAGHRQHAEAFARHAETTARSFSDPTHRAMALAGIDTANARVDALAGADAGPLTPWTQDRRAPAAASRYLPWEAMAVQLCRWEPSAGEVLADLLGVPVP